MEAAYGTLRLKSDHEDRDKVPSEIVLSSAEHQIGRSNPSSAGAAAHTHINLQYISGVHCVVRRTANRVELEDRSSNGTFVNDEKVGKGQTCQSKPCSPFNALTQCWQYRLPRQKHSHTN